MMKTTQDLVAQFEASGQTQQAFCAEHSISRSRLQYHLKRSRRQKATPGFVALSPMRAQPCAIVAVSGNFTPEQIVAVVKGLGR